MPKAIFVNPDGSRKEVEVPNGTNLMRAATDNGIIGIIGDCGGLMACATCHVFVDPQFLSRCSPIIGNEGDMLNYTVAPRRENSRLSCQIVMTDALDGIIVTVAEPQV